MKAAIYACRWCGCCVPGVATILSGRPSDDDDSEADNDMAGVHVSCPQCHARGPLVAFLLEPPPPIARPPGLAYMQSPRERAVHIAIEEWNHIMRPTWWVRAWRYLRR